MPFLQKNFTIRNTFVAMLSYVNHCLIAREIFFIFLSKNKC